MIDKDKITPGFLTRSAAETIRHTIDVTESNRRELNDLLIYVNDSLPAKLTAYTSGSGSGATGGGPYSWVEQWFLTDGTREDLPSGRSGNADWQPAYAVGGGGIITTFPVEVWLRRRVTTALMGPVYEFDLPNSGGDTAFARAPNPVTLDADGFATGCFIQEWNGPTDPDHEDGEEILIQFLPA